MAMANPVEPVIQRIKLADGEHEIGARYAVMGSTTTPTLTPIEDLISYSIKTYTTLPTASATYKNQIALVPDSSDTETGSYIEYICVNTSGTTWAWEPIGTTKFTFDPSNYKTSSAGGQTKNTTSNGAQTASGTATITYAKPNSTTGDTAPAFTGTAATITSTGSYTPAGSIGGSQSVSSHSHTVNVAKATLNLPTNAIKSVSLATATTGGVSVVTTAPTQAVEAGGHTHSLNLTKDSAQTLVTTAAIKSAVLATTTAAVGTGVIQVVTGVNNAASAGAHTHSITPSTTAIYPAANVTAVTEVASNYGFASSTSNVMTAPTVSTDGVLSWTLANAGTQAKASSTASVRGTSLTVVTGVTETGSAGAHTHSVGASATQKLTVTTEGASTISRTYVTGASATATSSDGAHTHSLSGAASSNIVASGAAADTSSITYVTGATLSKDGAATINGSNFSFSGTAATITVEADYTPAGSVASHNHSIGTTNTSATGTAAVAVASHTHSVTIDAHTHSIVAV